LNVIDRLTYGYMITTDTFFICNSLISCELFNNTFMFLF